MSHQHYGSIDNLHSQCGKLLAIFMNEYPNSHPVSAPYLAKRVGSLSIASVVSGLRTQLQLAGIGYDIVNSLKVEIVTYEDGTTERKVNSFYAFIPIDR